MKKKIPAWIVLCVICLVAAVLLAGVHEVTKEPIDKQQEQQFNASCKALLPDAAEFIRMENENVECYEARDTGGATVGYVAKNVVSGFGGEIELVVGTDTEGVMTGVQVGGANFSETPGLGAKTKEPWFGEQFAGKSYGVDLTKNGGEIDAVTAATISSSAVVRGVNDTLGKMADAGCFAVAKPASSVEELGEGRYAATVQGFGGPVYVELALTDGAITDIVIGDDSFAESANYGAKTREEAFYGQYIGKSGTALALGTDVDAVSGATVSSTAVNDAVNMILLYANDPEAFAASQTVPTDFADGEYVVKANGVESTFEVTVVIADNAVVSVKIGDTEPDSNDNYFLPKTQNEAFEGQFTGKTYPVDSVDIASGATVSSNAVLKAVNEAFEQAAE